MSEQDLMHVPLKPVIPTEDDMSLDRPKLHPPNEPWQDGIHAKHKKTGAVVHVRKVDLMTRQFRPVGVPRTEWHSFEEYDPLVEASPEQKAREAAAKELADERAAMTPEQIAIVDVLADDVDPIKALAKLRALRAIGTLAPAKATRKAPAKDEGQ